MTSVDLERFAQFTKSLIGLEVSHVWMGYGSAIFIEFGELHVTVRQNGKIAHNPSGEMTLYACEGWRIEGKRRIWYGSWSDKEKWPRVLKKVQGSTLVSISLSGRLGEIDLCFSNGLSFQTFMTNHGDPDWSLTDRQHAHLGAVAGRIFVDRRNQDVASQ